MLSSKSLCVPRYAVAINTNMHAIAVDTVITKMMNSNTFTTCGMSVNGISIGIAELILKNGGDGPRIPHRPQQHCSVSIFERKLQL